MPFYLLVLFGPNGIIAETIQTAELAEITIIKEMIAEDITNKQIMSEEGIVSDEDLEFLLQDVYGDILDNSDGVIRILTYDTIKETKFRKRYDVTVDKAWLNWIITHEHEYAWVSLDSSEHQGTCECGDIVTEIHEMIHDENSYEATCEETRTRNC